MVTLVHPVYKLGISCSFIIMQIGDVLQHQQQLAACRGLSWFPPSDRSLKFLLVSL
uniref:Uncharacterized protein n=1 Tax=Arundo donax TaxID=35708 RepID=A0A0A9SR41_ARUDO